MLDKLGDKARVLHIIDAVEEIKKYTEEVKFKEFEQHSMIQDACIRQLSIIGEACNRLSDELKDDNMDIEWRQIIGLRNIVIHQYFGVDIYIIWEVIQDYLPILQQRMREILTRFEE